MSFSLSNRALLRGMLAGAVVLTATACSRSDRTESGRDNSAVVLPDTSNNAGDASGGTSTGAVSDTATAPAQSSGSTQPSTPADSNSPRAATTVPSDSDAAGYHSMERDTTNIPNQHVDSARVTAATSDSAAPTDTATSTADTSAAGYAEMARDTSTVADQVDTAATDNAGRIRPPEDSTEILGNVTTPDDAADETADEQVVGPEDRDAVAASEPQTDEVGAAAVSGNVTGADAVALMSREGVRCAVVDPEVNEAVRWDMSSTPATLNPCGMGSMVLSRIWTAGQRDSWTAGQ